MSNSQVAHVWAQQTKARGKGSSFYFEGPTIYSYGPHFPIARFIERKGRKAVLFTTRGYSVSTAKHIGYARRALYGLPHPVFHVTDPSAPIDSADMRKAYAERVKLAAEEAAKARKASVAEMHVERAGRLAQEANECAEFFGWKWRVTAPAFSPEFVADVRARLSAERAAKVKATKAREEKNRAELAERAAAWRAGAQVSMWGYPDTLLRVNGNRIETSRGAEVPVRIAPAVWKLVQDARTTQTAVAPGLEIGLFRLDHVEKDGTIRAGCHTIAYAEIERTARALGLAS